MIVIYRFGLICQSIYACIDFLFDAWKISQRGEIYRDARGNVTVKGGKAWGENVGLLECNGYCWFSTETWQTRWVCGGVGLKDSRALLSLPLVASLYNYTHTPPSISIPFSSLATSPSPFNLSSSPKFTYLIFLFIHNSPSHCFKNWFGLIKLRVRFSLKK